MLPPFASLVVECGHTKSGKTKWKPLRSAILPRTLEAMVEITSQRLVKHQFSYMVKYFLKFQFASLKCLQATDIRWLLQIWQLYPVFKVIIFGLQLLYR